MQPLARDGLSAAQVTALLQAPSVTVSAGLERLNPSTLSPVEDISDDLLSGRVERNLYATIHTSCALQVTRALSWGDVLVRPFMTLNDGIVSARWNVGAFVLTTPDLRVGEVPATFDVQGFDRLYLLQRQVGDSYSVAAGTEYLTAIRDAVSAAGLSGVMLDSAAAGVTLPALRVWPLLQEGSAPTTWLRIVNDLLTAINYRGLFCDENGFFRSQPYVEPVSRAPEYTFDADEPRTILGEDRVLAEDRWSVPNRWVFIRSNMPGDPPAEPVNGNGIYRVDDTADQSLRGLVYPSVVTFEASSQAALVALGDRRVASDKRVQSILDLTVGPFPGLAHADIYTYRDVAVGTERKVQLRSATLDLLGADTRMVLERVG